MAKILHLLPYSELYPPSNGGQLRCFHLLDQIARTHEVHAVVLGDAGSDQELPLPTACERAKIYYAENSKIEASVFDAMPRRLGRALEYRWLRRSWRGPAGGFLLDSHVLIEDLLAKHHFDVVIFEHLSAMTAAPLVRRFAPKALRILDAHNIDHRLIEDKESAAFRQTLWLESHLSDEVHGVMACSEEDLEDLLVLNGSGLKGWVVPNGVSALQRPFDVATTKSACREILFCGSLDYEPNRDGLQWFHREIWPLICTACPTVKLVVIGRGSKHGYEALLADDSVDFVGEVEDVVPYYQRTGLAIVPLRKGSGTRLKILEAMSMGNPFVSTSIGAEGITICHEQDFLRADTPHDFANAVLRLLGDPSLFEKLRYSARQVIDVSYDWQVIGAGLSNIIGQILNNKSLLHRPEAS